MILIRDIVRRLPLWQRILLRHTTSSRLPVVFEPDHMYQEMQNNPKVVEALRDDIFIEGTILEDWENASNFDKVGKLLAVGEYETH